jgi:hypothetical protein
LIACTVTQLHAILAEINHFAPLLKLHAILTEILLFESNINVREHRMLVDPEYEYEEKRRLNKLVKDRLSQLGLSQQTLKNKRGKMARNLENKLISKCAHQITYENTPATIPATANPKCNRGINES